MKKLLLILPLLLLLGAEPCDQTIPLPPPPGPDDNPFCYGKPTLGSRFMSAVDDVTGSINAIFGGVESVDRRATLRLAMEGGRCTGVAIDGYHALTAAHCVRDAQQATAALGGYGEPPYWEMTGKTVHPNTDLAVIHYHDGDSENGQPLPEPHVREVFNVLNKYHASQCVMMRAQGWGKWEGDTLSLRECADDYTIDEIIWDGELYVRKHGPDDCRICFGDSGGPLYAEMADGSLQLAGITRNTWGECTIQSGHNALSPYEAWLNETLAE